MRSFSWTRGSIIYDMAITKDNLVISLEPGGTVNSWNISEGRKLAGWQDYDGARFAYFATSDGSRLVTGSDREPTRIRDPLTNTTVLTFATEGAGPAWYSPDGAEIATAEDNKIKLRDAQTGTVALTLTGHTGRINSLAFSADGRQLLSASHDRTMRIGLPEPARCWRSRYLTSAASGWQ